jgi:outer membrane protein OmpA-like peptidoglycan-associated protein
LNDKISKQRALAVQKYLQNAGVITRITTIAKDKREAFQLANLAIMA